METDNNVAYGTTPTYDGETPAKSATNQYTYTFNGWTPEVDEVTGDVTYTATYSSIVNKYTITWDVDGKETTETYEYGATPTFTGSTAKDADEQYTYTFTGWSPEIGEVTGDATYTAQYSKEVNSYTITWIVDGEPTTETYEYGATPEYKGEMPTKAYDGTYHYTFNGWGEIVPVTGNATYTATFTGEEHIYGGWQSDEEKHWKQCSCGNRIDEDTHDHDTTGNCVCQHTCQHTEMDHTAAVPATCEKDGNIEYWTCKDCGRHFDAAEKGNQRTESELVIPGGHVWGETMYNFAEDGKSCTATRSCTRGDCDATETATAEIKGNVSQEATCTSRGTTTYTATFTENWAETQTKDVVDIPKKEHAYEIPTYTWGENDATCTAKRVCGSCKGEETEEVKVAVATTKAPTCVDKGVDTYTADFVAEWAETQTKTKDVEALGHNWGEPSYTWAKDNSTCTATRQCSNNTCASCTESETVNTQCMEATPTCTEASETVFTAGFKSKWAEAQTKSILVAALGHQWGNPSYEWEQNANGDWICIATRTCTRAGCDAEPTPATETVTATATPEQTKAPTCTEKGEMTYTATFEETWATEQSKTEDIDVDKSNHTGSEEWTQTATTHTKAYTCCHTVTVETSAHDWNEGVCSTCKYQCQHMDENHDHACDNGCDVYQGTHADSATDNDHVCDYGCNVVLEDCSDKPGDGDHKCDVCGKADVTAHTYSDATCTDPKTCGECGATEGEKLDTITKVAAQEHNQTQLGNTEYYTCSRCNKYFSDENGENEIKENSWVIHHKDDDGNGHCDYAACNILMCTHDTLIKNEGEPATCAKTGIKVHWICDKCGLKFLDEAHTNRVDDVDLVIPKAAHTYGDANYNWATDSIPVTMTVTLTCSVCEDGVEGHTYVLDPVVAQLSSEVQGNCTEPGSKTYTASVEFNGTTYTDDELVLGTTDPDNHDFTKTACTEAEVWTACSRCNAEQDGTRTKRFFNVKVFDYLGRKTEYLNVEYNTALALTHSTSTVFELVGTGWRVGNEVVPAEQVWATFDLSEPATTNLTVTEVVTATLKPGMLQMAVDYNNANSDQAMTVDLFISVDSLEAEYLPKVLFLGRENPELQLEQIHPNINMYYVSITLTSKQITQGGVNVKITIDYPGVELNGAGEPDKTIDSVLIAYEDALRKQFENVEGNVAADQQEAAIQAMLNYGKMVQVYFGNTNQNEWDFAGFTSDQIKKMADSTKLPKTSSVTDEETKITFKWISANVRFDEEYSLRYEIELILPEGITAENATATLTVKDAEGKVLGNPYENLEVVPKGDAKNPNRYYITYPVPASDIAKEDTTVQITINFANGAQIASPEFEYGMHAFLTYSIYLYTDGKDENGNPICVNGETNPATREKTGKYVQMLASLLKLGESMLAMENESAT